MNILDMRFLAPRDFPTDGVEKSCQKGENSGKVTSGSSRERRVRKRKSLCRMVRAYRRDGDGEDKTLRRRT